MRLPNLLQFFPGSVLLFALLSLPLVAQPTPPTAPLPPDPPESETAVEPADPVAPVEPVEPSAPRSPVRPASLLVFGNDIHVPSEERAREAIAVFGNVAAEGNVTGGALAIVGNLSVDGSAGEVVAVFGNVTINGTVNGDVVAVFGGVQLGPNAVINGDVTAIGGAVARAPGAIIRRDVHELSFMRSDLPELKGLKAWLTLGVMLGRPLAVGEHLGWVWVIAGAFLAIYILITAVFPRGVLRCAETLEARPGFTVAASLLTALALPVLAVLLSVTVVGPVILVMATLAATLVGKAAFITWMGRRVTVPLGLRSPVLAAILGGVLLAALYLIPYLGFLIWKLSGVLGLGMVVYGFILMLGRERAQPGRTPPAVPQQPQPLGAASGTMPDVMRSPEALAETGATVLPRAGFWIRIAASLIDLFLIGVMVTIVDPLGILFAPLFAVYCVCLWALKATTIGGIVCGLTIVRLDGQRVTWTVALVRLLGGFLSLAAAGLGFIWVAFDDEKQSWHDKIAGTTIVRVPRSQSLI